MRFKDSVVDGVRLLLDISCSLMKSMTKDGDPFPLVIRLELAWRRSCCPHFTQRTNAYQHYISRETLRKHGIDRLPWEAQPGIKARKTDVSSNVALDAT
jgi:hypothetical protein